MSSHSAGGRKSTVKVSAGPAPSGGPGPGLSPGFWWLPATLGVLLACGHITPVSASVSLGGLPVYLLKSPLPMRTPGIGVRTHRTPAGPYLDLQRPHYGHLHRYWAFGHEYLLGGHESIHNRDGAGGSKEAFLQSGKGREWASAGARLGMLTSPVKAAHRDWSGLETDPKAICVDKRLRFLRAA